MRDYNRIIESLDVKFIKTRHIKVLQALTIENFYDVENVLLILNKGHISYTQEEKLQTVVPGEVLFMPGGKATTITYGSQKPINLNNDYFINNRWKYFEALPEISADAGFENFSYITFDAKVFNSVNFFASLDIPAFVLKEDKNVNGLLKNILAESSSEGIGSERIVRANIEQIVKEIVL